MKTWFKSALAAVATCVLALGAFAANVSDTMTSDFGDVVKSKAGSGENVYTVTFDGAKMPTNFKADGTGLDATWTITAKIVKENLNPDLMASGGYSNFWLGYKKITLSSPASFAFEDEKTYLDVRATGTEGTYEFTLTRVFNAADLRTMYQNPFDPEDHSDVAAEAQVKAVFSADWDRVGNCESLYVLTVDPAKLVLKDSADRELWNVNDQLRVDAAVVGDAVNSVTLSNHVFDVFGNINSSSLARFKFSLTNEPNEMAKVSIAAIKFSDSFGNVLRDVMSYPLWCNSPYYSNPANYILPLEKFTDYTGGLEEFFKSDSTKAFVGFYGEGNAELKKRCEMAALAGSNYTVTVEFDLDGDGDFEPFNKYDFVFDSSKVSFDGEPVAKVSGAALEQVLYKPAGSIEYVGNKTGTVDTLTVTFAGPTPALRSCKKNSGFGYCWNAPIKITLPSWYTDTKIADYIDGDIARDGSAAYTFYKKGTGSNAIIDWQPWIFASELVEAKAAALAESNEVGTVTRTLKLDLDRDGTYEVTYNAVFASDLWLYGHEAGKSENPSKYWDKVVVYPCGTNALDCGWAHISTEKGANTNCAAVTSVGTDVSVTFDKVVTESAKDSKAWKATFQVVAPKWVCNDDLAKEVTITTGSYYKFINCIDEANGKLWSSTTEGGTRYVFTVEMTIDPVMLVQLGDEAFANVEITWGKETTVPMAISVAKPEQLNYESGETAWKVGGLYKEAGAGAWYAYADYKSGKTEVPVAQKDGVTNTLFNVGTAIGNPDPIEVSETTVDNWIWKVTPIVSRPAFLTKDTPISWTLITNKTGWAQYWDRENGRWENFEDMPWDVSKQKFELGDVEIYFDGDGKAIRPIEPKRFRFCWDFESVATGVENYVEYVFEFQTNNLALYYQADKKAWPTTYADYDDWQVNQNSDGWFSDKEWGARGSANMWGRAVFKQRSRSDNTFTYATLLLDMPKNLWPDYNAGSAYYDKNSSGRNQFPFMGVTTDPACLTNATTGIQGRAPITFSFADYVNAIAYNKGKATINYNFVWQPWIAPTNYAANIDFTETSLYYYSDSGTGYGPIVYDYKTMTNEEFAYNLTNWQYSVVVTNAILTVDGSVAKSQKTTFTIDKDCREQNDWSLTLKTLVTAPTFITTNSIGCFQAKEDYEVVRGADGLYTYTLEKTLTLAELRSALAQGTKITASAPFNWNFNGWSAPDTTIYTIEVDPNDLTIFSKDGYQVFPSVMTDAKFEPVTRNPDVVTPGIVEDANTLVFNASNPIKKFAINNVWPGYQKMIYPPEVGETAEKNFVVATLTRPSAFDTIGSTDENARNWENVRARVGTSWATWEPVLLNSFKQLDDIGSKTFKNYFFLNIDKDEIESFVKYYPDKDYFEYTISVDWENDGSFAYQYHIKLDITATNHIELVGEEWTQYPVTTYDWFNPSGNLPNQGVVQTGVLTPTVFDTVVIEAKTNTEFYAFDDWYASTSAGQPMVKGEDGKYVVWSRGNGTTTAYAKYIAYAMTVDGVGYKFADIAQAFRSIKDGSKITLRDSDKNNEIVLDQYQAITNNDVTIDLGGKKLKITDMYFEVTGKNVVITNGSIILQGVYDSEYNERAGLFYVDGGSLTLGNVKVEAGDMQTSQPPYTAIWVQKGGELTLDGSSISLSTYADYRGSDYGSEIIYIDADSKATIKGGSRVFNYNVNEKIFAKSYDAIIPSAITVEGELYLTDTSVTCNDGVGIYGCSTNALVKLGTALPNKVSFMNKDASVQGRTAIYMLAGHLEIAPQLTKSSFFINGFGEKCPYNAAAFSEDGSPYIQATGDAVVLGPQATASIAGGYFDSNYGRAIQGYDAAGNEVKAYDYYPVLPSATGWLVQTPSDTFEYGIYQGYYNTNEFEMQKYADSYAYFVGKSYELKYELNGGSQTNDLPTAYTVESTDALPTCLVKKNWYFAGWYFDTNLTEKAETFADVVAQLRATAYAQVTVYAKWVETPYTLTLATAKTVNDVIYDGAALTTKEVGFDVTKNYTVKIPTCKGYTFLGWLDAETGIMSDPSVEVELNTVEYNGKTLTAQWKANVYTITYDDARGNEAELVYTVESNVTFPTACTADGYDFVKWSIPSTEGYAEDLTVTASWTSKVNGKAKSAIDAAVAFNPASSLYYTGFVVKDGAMIGTVSFTAAKAVKAGTSTVRATVKLVDEKTSTRTEKVVVADTASEINLGTVLGKAKINNEAAEGESVFAALNAKVDAAKNYVVAFETQDAAGKVLGDTTLRISLAKSGKATVSGVLFDGTTFSTTAQAMQSYKGVILPVVYNRAYNYAGYTTYGGMAALLRIDGDEITFEKDVTPSVVAYNKGVQTAAKLANKAAGVVDKTAGLAAGAKVTISDGNGHLATGYVNKYGTSVSFAKADLGGANSGRLSYTKSNGAMTGSFSVKINGKNVTFTVKGIVINCTDACTTTYGTVSGEKVSGSLTIVIGAE